MVHKNKSSHETNPEKYEFKQIPTEETLQSEERKTHWFSIYIAAALSFTGCIQNGLYFSAVWPYLQEVYQKIFNLLYLF